LLCKRMLNKPKLVSHAFIDAKNLSVLLIGDEIYFSSSDTGVDLSLDCDITAVEYGIVFIFLVSMILIALVLLDDGVVFFTCCSVILPGEDSKFSTSELEC